MTQEKKVWFKAKRFGWGWYPASWQGWLVTIAYVAIIFFFARTISEDSSPREVGFTFIIPLLIVSLLFIRLAYRTGEKPSFRWGKKKK